MTTKTRGQRLYEHKNPEFIRVIPVDKRHFPTEADVFLTPNPNYNHAPWWCLTPRTKASWERSAEGHNLFSGEPPCPTGT